MYFALSSPQLTVIGQLGVPGVSAPRRVVQEVETVIEHAPTLHLLTAAKNVMDQSLNLANVTPTFVQVSFHFPLSSPSAARK